MSADLAESRVKWAVCWFQLGAGLVNQGWEMTTKLWPPGRSVKGPFPVPQGAFSGHLGQLWVALVVVGHLQSPALQHPPACPWQKQMLAVPSVHWAAQVSAHLLPSCHSRCLLQPGKAAGNWHQPGLVAGKRRMKQQGKGLNTVVFFTREKPGLLPCISFAPGKDRNNVCAGNIGRPGKSWLLSSNAQQRATLSHSSVVAAERYRGQGRPPQALFRGGGGSPGSAGWNPKCCRALKSAAISAFSWANCSHTENVCWSRGWNPVTCSNKCWCHSGARPPLPRCQEREMRKQGRVTALVSVQHGQNWL